MNRPTPPLLPWPVLLLLLPALALLQPLLA